MDLCSFILNEMILAVEDRTVRGALLFGRLVTELCRANLVVFGNMDDLIKGMAPIDGGTLKRSRSARPSEREEVQEEEDEEREEFLTCTKIYMLPLLRCIPKILPRASN